MCVGQIVKLLDRLPDTFAETLADQGRAIHGPGDGGDGDFGRGGNSANVWKFAGGLALWFTRHEPILMQRDEAQRGK